MNNDKVRERNLELLYYIYLVIAIYFAVGLVAGSLPADLGDNLLKSPRGILFPPDEAFVEFTVTLTSAYLVFATIIGFLGALLSIGTRNVFEILALFFFGMLPRERKYWGVVFDQDTNHPISFIPVRLFEYEGDKPKLLSQTVTDSDGRYRLHIEKPEAKRYTIEINYPGYEPVITELQKYVAIGNYEFVNDIALVKSNNVKAQVLKWFYYNRPRLFTYLFLSIYYVYAFFWLIQFIFVINEPIFINILVAVTYTVTFIWNTKILRQRLKPAIGKIKDAETHKPISSAIVTLYTNEAEKISAITDDQGVVKLNIPSGMYKMLVSAKGYLLLSKDEKGLELVKIGKDGYIDKDVLLQRQVGSEVSVAGAELINPFQ